MANLIPEGMTSQGTLNVSAQEQDAEEQAEELNGVELEELSDPGLDVMSVGKSSSWLVLTQITNILTRSEV